MVLTEEIHEDRAADFEGRADANPARPDAQWESSLSCRTREMTGLRRAPHNADASGFGASRRGTALSGRAPFSPDTLLCEAMRVFLVYDRYNPERHEPVDGGFSCPIAGWRHPGARVGRLSETSGGMSSERVPLTPDCRRPARKRCYRAVALCLRYTCTAHLRSNFSAGVCTSALPAAVRWKRANPLMVASQ